MNRITFPYVARRLLGGAGATVHRPLAQVVISSESARSVTWIVVLDTGSDACTLPLHLAVSLGIKLPQSPGAVTTGVGRNASPTYFAPVTFDLGRGVRFETLAGFTSGLGPASFGLLGQEGFFSRYNVEFRHADREFLIEVP